MALSKILPASQEVQAVGKNLIINGAMQVAQRGTSSSTGNGFAVDRFTNPVSQSSKLTVQQNAGSVTPPAGFQYYYGMTSSSAYTPISTDYFYVGQNIEGYNVAHLDWGTANAKTVTLSFWVRSSLTGTFGGSIQNSAQNRSYPFSYAISSANTWEYKTVTIPGDTTGTWLKTNGKGAVLWFSVGAGSNNQGTDGAWAAANYASVTGAVDVVGTNGATWYITGVQLEVGSTATDFDHSESYGETLAKCQRYYEQSDRTTAGGNREVQWRKYNSTATWHQNTNYFVVQKRANPTIVVYDSQGNANRVNVNDNISDPANITPQTSGANNTRSMYMQVQAPNVTNGFSYNYSADAEL